MSDQRIHNTVIKREINTKTKLIEMLKSDEEKLTEKLRNLKSRSVSITDRMQQLEQILQVASTLEYFTFIISCK